VRKLHVGVIDLVTKNRTRAMWARVMHANLAGIMPQIVATWCEEEGHEVTFVCYTGFENLVDELPKDVDLVIIGAFTQTAQLSYALSNLFRSRGAVTALGGPHARCYPQDAQKYFDYVIGFTDKRVISDMLRDASQHRPTGVHLCAKVQPDSLPGVRERWKFIEQTLQKAPLAQIVPMLGSIGCPYSCSFCIDASVPYKQLDVDVMKEDLKFLRTKYKRPHVGWYDPNFGIRFDETLDAIEEAVPINSIDFIAESTLAVLTEPHIKRLKKNGFIALLPGIESWYEMGGKSKTGNAQGVEKVKQVAEHANMILEYIPYLQVNFVLGLDVDEGAEPFELTKRFLDLSPGSFPAYSLLSAFGQAASLNLDYQRAGRVLPVPFHFLNNNHAMNVKPLHYSWREFYDRVIDLSEYSFSWRATVDRVKAVRKVIPKLLNVMRARSSEGVGRIKYYRTLRDRLDTDIELRGYFDGKTTELPTFFLDRITSDLGPLWDWLPEGALYHDAHAYLNEVEKAG
jgi:hypothetical protein